MTTYLRPGVFVNESLQTLVNSPLSNTTDAIPTFVGTVAKGGPVGPTLISSWSQFTALFGDIKGTVSDDLPFAVYHYFNNGGNQCYVVRAVNSDAVAGHIALAEDDPDGAGPLTAQTCMTVTAKAPGTWSCTGPNTIYISIDKSVTTQRFDLIVEVGQGQGLVARETFTNLTLDPADARNAIAVINSPTVGSKYVSAVANGTWSTTPDATHVGNPATVTAVALVSGSDGTGTPDLYGATQLLANLDSILLVNLPGCSSNSVLTNVINWAQTAGNRFVVVDAPKPSPGDTNITTSSNATTFADSLPVSAYAAVYAPWVWAVDPSSSIPGALRLTAPGGAVLGQYVRNDLTRAVAKAPAGTGSTVQINQAYCTFTPTQLDALNQASVNVIKNVPGVGFCVWGARTLNVGQIDMYINVRRTLLYIKQNLINLTQFAVMENNDPSLWATVRSQISQFLTQFWMQGGLAGNTTGDAFYVVCDSTNNTQASINAGSLNVSVGVALQTPAEFVVINLGQYSGGNTTVTDSLTPVANQ